MQKTIIIGQREYPVLALLLVKEGAGIGREFPIYKERIVIGRDGNACQVVVDEPAASSQHCAVVFRQGSFYLSDLASRNGTYVNPTGDKNKDHPVRDAYMLADGDVVGIGATRLLFKRAW